MFRRTNIAYIHSSIRIPTKRKESLFLKMNMAQAAVMTGSAIQVTMQKELYSVTAI